MLPEAQCQWFMEDALGKLRPELSGKVKDRQGLLCLHFALQKQPEGSFKNVHQIG